MTNETNATDRQNEIERLKTRLNTLEAQERTAKAKPISQGERIKNLESAVMQSNKDITRLESLTKYMDSRIETLRNKVFSLELTNATRIDI